MIVHEREYPSSTSPAIPPGIIVGVLGTVVLAIAIYGAFSWWSSPGSASESAPVVIPAAAGESLANLMALDQQSSVSVKGTEHSALKHGNEAEQIRRCLDRRGGTIDVWKLETRRRPNQFFQVCQMEDGRMGLRLIEKLKNGLWREKTSFVVKAGSPGEALEYLTARALRWTGRLSEWRFTLPPS